MSIPELSVRRPITVLMATLAVAIFGLLAARRLPVDLLPDLSYPTLTIQTAYPDAAPVSVEQFVTRPIEEGVGVIPGVREMRSTSRAGISEVVLEFEWDEEMDFAALEVREKLGLVQLPQEADVPRVLRFDPSLDPIVRIALTGERPLDELRRLAERWLKPRLEAVRGVAAAKVRGGLAPEVQVEADEDRLAALGLTLDDLGRALQADNVNQPGGTLKDLNAVYLVRTLNEFDDLDQLRRTVVRESAQGRVRVEDVAKVARGHRDREEITRSRGSEVVEIALHREGSANTVAVARAIRKEMDEIRTTMAADLRLDLLADQSRYISEAVEQVWTAAIIGAILAIFILYFFLRDLASTAIIALSIPTSVVATFLCMQQAGVTLNIMSLGGLALGAGMLVDNSIVVLEAIDRRRREGASRRDAAHSGAGDVAGAVTAATLTTVAVFFPIVFVRGVAGQLFYDQAVTVCFSLMTSLAVSLTLIPVLASLDPARARTAERATMFRWDQPQAPDAAALSIGSRLWGFARRGVKSAKGRWALVANILLVPLRLLAVPVALVLLGVQWAADRIHGPVSRFRVGRLGLPPLGNPEHPSSRLLTVLLFPLRLAVFIGFAAVAGLWWAVRWLLQILFFVPGRLYQALAAAYPPALSRAVRLRWAVLGASFALLGLSIAAVPMLGTALVPDLSQGEFAFRLRFPEGTPLESTALAVERIEAPFAADARFARVFSVVGSLPSSASGRRTLGENLAQIDFVLPDGAEPEDEEAAVARVREALATFPDAEAELVHPSLLAVRPPVVVQVLADDLPVLDEATGRVEAALRTVTGLEDIASTAEPGSPEILVELDRERAGTLGLTASQVGSSLRRQIRGDLIGKFREGEDRLDIRLRASAESRSRASEVESLRIRLPEGRVVPVSAVARVDVGRGPAAIRRTGGSRVAEVSAKTTVADLGLALERVRDTIARAALPPGARAEMAGQDRELEDSFASLKLAIALALFLVYVVMASQFESLLHPFVILMAVPLAIVGVVVGLAATGTTISVLVLIGAVMLAGIVVNNAIVLVDAINRRRREGQALDEAIVEAGRERLRPILMTTATTVLGLLPMAIGLGAGDELRAPLAITVISGLTAATGLTLIVTPCLYRAFSGLEGGRRRAAAPLGERLAPGLAGGGGLAAPPGPAGEGGS